MSDDRWVPWPLGDNRPVPFPLSGIPNTINDLIGKKCRFVKLGDRATTELEPGRITIILDESSRIHSLYIDPPSPTVADR